ncbi:NUDIX domain-containing protein [Annulohypoxylon bovei var. microspora]|nr:NUDIX domain-containing protein [Annulohypoxylon bovei var. microspora]
MAAVWWESTLYPSEQFVEACGAIVFDTSTSPKRILLLHYGAEDEWLLPKGRRNCNESRKDAAIREVREETGYAIKMRPVTMATRAPCDSESADVKDVARTYDSLTEPFMLDVRDLGKGKGVKLVWWFIAELGGIAGEGEVQFKPEFFRCDKAVERLTFKKDREVLTRALELMGLADNILSSYYHS